MMNRAVSRRGMGRRLPFEAATPPFYRRRLRRAPRTGIERGPEKYEELEMRRRRAQIRARRLLGLV
jgi:hypothetical protein